MTLTTSQVISKIKQFLSWLDIHGLFLLSAFLIVFIPLFPKIPIFDVLPGYIVRARPEDLIIAITGLVWIKDALKKRFAVSSSYFWIVVLYSISGFFSILLGTLLIQSIPAQLLHIGKSGLHLFRYLEYFAIFFFAYSSIKTQKQLKIILTLLALTVIVVVLYGFGQEYFHFPLFSTMNREYSKGTILYLQEGARPQSTFAGHYDLAAYLVIVLPIIFSVALSLLNIDFKHFKKTFFQRATYISMALHLTHILGAWMLVTSGSKTALLAYVVGIFIVLVHFLHTLGNWKQQLKWGSVSFILLAGALTLFLTFFAQSTKNKIISLINTTLSNSEIPVDQNATPDDLVGDGVVFKQITVKNDDGTETTEWVEERSTWSQNALKYGLSMGIRLDTLWPNALKGFINNPLFGNGYATLVSISNPGEYSTAESTDNNFLRTLGETGLIGFLTFYGLIAVIMIEIFKTKSSSLLTQALKIGFLGSIFGLLINATYIDVFAASKVAYTFWAFAGITLALLKPPPLISIMKIKKHMLKHWPIYLVTILALFLLHKNPFHEHALIKNLDVTDSQIESITTAHCFFTTGSFNLCTRNGVTSDQRIEPYSVLLVPFFKINPNPMMFYFLNISIVFTALIGIYLVLPHLIKKYTNSKLKKFLLFTTVSLYVIIVTALQITNRPLTTLELLSFLFLLPLLLTIYTILIHRIYYQLAYFTQIAAVLIALLFLVNMDFDKQFLNQFRNDQISDKYALINLANVHFDLRSYLNRDKDYLLITTLNPYYVDLFSNKHYSALPISESQSYLSAEKHQVYNKINLEKTLLEQYSQLADDAHLYVTDFQTYTNETLRQAFLDIKQTFDLSYVAIGCEDTCSLFEVKPETAKTSAEPVSITNKKIVLDSLQDEYAFTVVSNRYEPRTILDGINPAKYTTAEFATFLNNSVPQTNSFVIVSGDVAHDTSPVSDSVFKTTFNRLPLLYTSGNFTLQSSKQYSSKDTYFYTESEFFLFLTVSEESQITEAQQLFLYNALLQIEKLPNIKNIFIIAHELNWEDRSNPDNLVFELERKLAQFPELERYIITSNHSQENDPQLLRSEPSIRHILDPNTNIHYLSSSVRGWPNDAYFEFIVKENDEVEILEKLRN